MKHKFQKLVREYESTAVVLGALGAVATAVAFLFLTFMTISSGDKAQAQMKDYVDGKYGETQNSLAEVKQVVDRIDGRVYELLKEREKHGRSNARD